MTGREFITSTYELTGDIEESRSDDEPQFSVELIIRTATRCRDELIQDLVTGLGSADPSLLPLSARPARLTVSKLVVIGANAVDGQPVLDVAELIAGRKNSGVYVPIRHAYYGDAVPVGDGLWTVGGVFRGNADECWYYATSGEPILNNDVELLEHGDDFYDTLAYRTAEELMRSEFAGVGQRAAFYHQRFARCRAHLH